MTIEDIANPGLSGTIASVTPEFVVGHETDIDFIDTWVHEIVLREKLAFLQVARWQTKKRVRDLPHDALICASCGTWKECAALMLRGMLVYVILHLTDECEVWVFSSRYSPGDAEAVVAQLKGWLEPKVEASPDRVLVGFRYMGEKSGIYRSRSIDAPAWEEIRGNYAAAVQQRIDPLAASFEPGGGGRVILFHGEPGTGKTYVIRALARAWREWARFEYIADPEVFFGTAQYMMQALIHGHDDIDDDDDDAKQQRWRILVLEDAGELLSRDAKLRQGQGLSRLLNMSEGLIGQGLRVMTLITTNEPLDTLNEAVSRPGRTAAEVEFAPLSMDESNAWLLSHGAEDKRVEQATTLAELYAIASGEQPPSRRASRAIGLKRSE